MKAWAARSHTAKLCRRANAELDLRAPRGLLLRPAAMSVSAGGGTMRIRPMSASRARRTSCARGHEVVSIGNLHFHGEGNNGFSEKIIPIMDVVESVGDVLGLIRDRVFERGVGYKMAALAGPR